MRASATAPSLATSNASRKDLADLQDERAATLLSRVASYSAHHAQMGYEHGGRSSIGSACSSPGTSPSSSHSGRKGPFEVVRSQGKLSYLLGEFLTCADFRDIGGNYYSFPSFDDLEEYHEREGTQNRSSSIP